MDNFHCTYVYYNVIILKTMNGYLGGSATDAVCTNLFLLITFMLNYYNIKMKKFQSYHLDCYVMFVL